MAENVITLTAALSPEYEAAFKAAEAEAKSLAGELSGLEKQEEKLARAEEARARLTEASQSGNARAIQKAQREYDKAARAAGVFGKSQEGVASELDAVRDKIEDVSGLKKAVDARAEAGKTAVQVKHLREVYAKFGDPKVKQQLDRLTASLRRNGIEANVAASKKGGLGKFRDALKSAMDGAVSANPVLGGLTKVFGAIPPAIGVGVVALTAAVKGVSAAKKAIEECTASAIKSGDEIAKQAASVGMSGESYQKYAYAMRRGGASSEAFADGIKTLEQKMGDAISGSKEAQDAFKMFGVSLKDLKNKKPEEIFLQLADGIKSIEDPQIRAKQSMALLGGQGMRLAHAMSVGSDELLRLGEEAAGTGNVMSEAFLSKAEHGADEMENLSMHVEGLKNQIGMAASEGKIARLEALNQAFAENKDTVKLLADTVGGYSNAMDQLAVLGVKALSGLAKAWRVSVQAFADSFQWWDDLISGVFDKVKEMWDMLKSAASFLGKEIGGALGSSEAELKSKAEAVLSRPMAAPTQQTITVQNNIDARGASPGAEEGIVRAVKEGASVGGTVLEKLQAQTARLSYAGGYSGGAR